MGPAPASPARTETAAPAEEPAVEEPAPAAPAEEPAAEEPVAEESAPAEEPAEEAPASPSLSQRMGAFKVDEQRVDTPTPTKSSSGFKVKSETCSVCDKRVYAMDKMVADGVIFHKTCMKCTHCSKTLGLGNFAALNGKYYCKPHFKQLFQAKGNYSDGFGEEAPTAKWEPQAPTFATGTKKFN